MLRNLRMDKDFGSSLPWYMGYSFGEPAIRCDVFYIIPLNFIVRWWNQVLSRLQRGPYGQTERSWYSAYQQGQIDAQQRVQKILDKLLNHE